MDVSAGPPPPAPVGEGRMAIFFWCESIQNFLDPKFDPKSGSPDPLPPGGLGDPGLEKNTQSEPSLGHERVFPHGSFINVQS